MCIDLAGPFDELTIITTSLSAGVGRTGTFITIDNILDQISKENVVDIAGMISKLRQKRMKMVQTMVSWISGSHAFCT